MRSRSRRTSPRPAGGPAAPAPASAGPRSSSAMWTRGPGRPSSSASARCGPATRSSSSAPTARTPGSASSAPAATRRRASRRRGLRADRAPGAAAGHVLRGLRPRDRALRRQHRRLREPVTASAQYQGRRLAAAPGTPELGAPLPCCSGSASCASDARPAPQLAEIARWGRRGTSGSSWRSGGRAPLPSGIDPVPRGERGARRDGLVALAATGRCCTRSRRRRPRSPVLGVKLGHALPRPRSRRPSWAPRSTR